MKFIRDLFYGPSNTHWDLARVLTGLFSIGLIGGIVYNIAQGGGFEPVSYAQAAGLILGAGGLGIAAKDIARPKGLLDGEKPRP